MVKKTIMVVKGSKGKYEGNRYIFDVEIGKPIRVKVGEDQKPGNLTIDYIDSEEGGYLFVAVFKLDDRDDEIPIFLTKADDEDLNNEEKLSLFFAKAFVTVNKPDPIPEEIDSWRKYDKKDRMVKKIIKQQKENAK